MEGDQRPEGQTALCHRHEGRERVWDRRFVGKLARPYVNKPENDDPSIVEPIELIKTAV
jgi:hypothetical protein